MVDRGEVPVASEQAELLSKSNSGLNQVVERVSVFGAAMDVILFRLVEHLGREGTLVVTPENKEALESIGVLVKLFEAVSCNCDEESEFCARFEQMVQDDLLRKAGIDPKDEKTVAEFFGKTAKALILTPGNPLS